MLSKQPAHLAMIVFSRGPTGKMCDPPYLHFMQRLPDCQLLLLAAPCTSLN
jgi:hypothetical protein